MADCSVYLEIPSGRPLLYIVISLLFGSCEAAVSSGGPFDSNVRRPVCPVMAKVLLSYSPVVLFTLLVIGMDAVTTDSIAPAMPNFYAADVLDDGQVERRFFLNGIALKETSAIYTLNGTK